MYEDTKVSQLVINHLTEEKFKELLENDELDQNQLYMTDDRAGYTPPLLSTLWSDHTINDISWLRADTFSWQSGDVYKAAYNHLVADFEGAVAETTTIDGIEITYYLADDKHIICLPDQESNIVALYELTGVAWYYILDTENQQFKLPRTQYGFTGLRDSVGNYVPESLPNITGTSGTLMHQRGAPDSFDGALYNTYATYYGEGSGSNNTGVTLHLDASISSPTYQDNAPVQERATQMYLYFYVGNFERDAVEQTAGVTTETLNGKADSDLGNIPANYDYVVESQMPTTENGYTWYRKYKSGWVEQGGIFPAQATVTATLPIEMSDNNYQVLLTGGLFTPTTSDIRVKYVQTRTTTSFTASANSAIAYMWQVSGMSAQ